MHNHQCSCIPIPTVVEFELALLDLAIVGAVGAIESIAKTEE
jgi:hypothetical protein